MSHRLSDILETAATLQEAGRAVAACVLVKARGSTPQSAGALMLVDDSAQIHGTIGGGCVEAEVRRQAHALLMTKGTGVLTFKLDHDYGWDDGLICGGTVEIAVARLPGPQPLRHLVSAIHAREAASLDLEVDDAGGLLKYVMEIPPRERLYIAGAGHVGVALARLAMRLDFQATVFDDREDALARVPDGCGRVSGDIAASLKAAAFDGRTCVVIVTRGHSHDEQALEAALNRGAAYVGMIGSRRKVKLIFDDLAERGVSRDALAAVHAPVGLDIGAITVEEIAMSIAAQLIQVRRAGHRSPIRGPFRGDAAGRAISNESPVVKGHA